MNPLSGQTIVFLPGMDGTGISFEPLARALAQDVKVKVVKYPADRLLSFEDTVQCAKEQIQNDQGDVIVLAESFSGPVAIALLGSGQVKAKGLILCSTFARSPRPVLLRILSCLPMEFILNLPFPSFLLKCIVQGEEEATDLFIGLWERVRAVVPAKVLVHRLKLISQVDVREWLPKLTLPCLYIQSSSQRSVPASSLFDFAEAIPDLRVKRINGPHFILQAQPLKSIAAIENFVGLITGSPDRQPKAQGEQHTPAPLGS
ncbi:MAG: alpha/beta hydrolase [Desulfobacterota bacterium]|jgi:pimeloyl-ACP methyl ester carboxylesterase|nr:alpha/beta hydrolase [Thermodesulfobacteriota bacterium]